MTDPIEKLLGEGDRMVRAGVGPGGLDSTEVQMVRTLVAVTREWKWQLEAIKKMGRHELDRRTAASALENAARIAQGGGE